MIPSLHRTRTLHLSITSEDSDRTLILETFGQAGWIHSKPHGAAESLGLKRTTLLARMRSLVSCGAYLSGKNYQPSRSRAMKMPGFEGRIGSRTCNKVSSRQARTDSRSKTCHRLAGSRAGPATMDEGCFLETTDHADLRRQRVA